MTPSVSLRSCSRLLFLSVLSSPFGVGCSVTERRFVEVATASERTPLTYVRSGPFHRILRPAVAELVSGGPYPLYVSAGGHASQRQLPHSILRLRSIKQISSQPAYAAKKLGIRAVGAREWRRYGGRSEILCLTTVTGVQSKAEHSRKREESNFTRRCPTLSRPGP